MHGRKIKIMNYNFKRPQHICTVNISKLLFFIICINILLTTQAQNFNNPNKTGPLGTQVNTYNGNLHLPRIDDYITARGLDLNVSFFYNSLNFDQKNGYGNGWGFAYHIKYKNDTANSKTFVWGDGREDNYIVQGTGYKTPLGMFTSLIQYQPNKFLITEIDGSKYYFDNNNHRCITRLEDRNGNFINFTYTDTLLTSMINNAGQSISFIYNGSGNLASVTDAVTAPSRSWVYTYDSYANLIKVTDPLGAIIKYGYLVNGPMKMTSDKNNNTIDIIYYPDFTVSEIIGCNKRQSFSYDTLNNVTVSTDYLNSGNQVTTYKFKRFGSAAWLSALTSNCCGFNMTFDFDNNGNKIKQTDGNGNITRYTYDSRGNLLTITDPLGNVLTYTYSTDFNKVTSFTDPKGNVTTMTYTSYGDLTQVVEPGNLVSTAAYNSNGDLISSTDPKGNTYSYTYDAFGNPQGVSGPNGFHATTSFDARGNLLSLTDPRGYITSVQYDILDREKKIIDPNNNNIQANYDAGGNITSIVNQNGEVSKFKFDASNRLVQFTDAMNKNNTVSYDAMDNVSGMANSLGNGINFTYDKRNRLSNIRDQLGNTGNLSYDAKGNVTSMTLPNGNIMSYTYDQDDRRTSINDLTSLIASMTYDKNNNITSYTNGTGATTTATFDIQNRVKSVTDPLGNTASLTYDQNDHISTVTDRNGYIKTFTYDSLDRIKTFTDKIGSIITFNYDLRGNIISTVDQKNNTTTYVYDSVNRVKIATYPDGKFVQYTYDKKGNVVNRKMPDGTNISYVYDSLNRVVSKNLPNGNAFIYAYDAIGRVSSATNNAGTVNFTYDPLNRISSETFDGRTTRYNYNTSGRTQTMIYPDSTTIIQGYDTRNRLISISKGNNNIATYQYNNADQMTGKVFGNGIITTMQYDFANRLSNFSTSNNSLQNTSFTYDKEMHKQTISRLNNPALSEQYVYDHNYRITNYKRGPVAGTPAVQNTYSYDALGNRTSVNLNGILTTYTINNLNQITNVTGPQNINYTYDNNGNLTYDGRSYKTYDSEGKQLKDSSSVSNVLTYTYDVFGRRVQKNYNGVPWKYTFSGLSQLEERDGISGNLKTRTVFSNFLSPVLNDKNGVSYYYHQNETNSVEAITNTSGNLTERYQYDLYGKQTIYDSMNNLLPGSLAGNRFGFTGQEYDSATGNIHFFFRNYSTETGTFNQRDLIGNTNGMGMYQYVHNDPANGIDIYGLDDCDPVDKITKNWVDYSDDVLFWGGQNSNLGSYLQIFESSTTKTKSAFWMTSTTLATGEVSTFGRTVTTLEHGFLGSASKFVNSTPLSVLMTPINIANTVAPLYDMYQNGGQMTGAQILDNSMSSVSSGATSYVGVYGLTQGSGALSATSLASAPVAFAATALAGGLAIEGVANWGYKKATGEGFTDVGYNHDIPYFTSASRTFWNWYDEVDDVERGARRYQFFHGNVDKWDQYSNKKRHPVPHSAVVNGWKPRIIDCPHNTDPNGPRTRRYYHFDANGDSVLVIQSRDPNIIIGPDGVPAKRWVSVKDRMPYTILFENDKSASAPAKFVRITSPVQPKQDAGSFQLGIFGFNNQIFSVTPGIASYYQRLDCKDSLGLYVDVTAGYDQISNNAFWEFQSIDPTTLLPPTNPLKGFLLLQDSAHANNGHAFVNFSMKPLASAVTLDTIGARATIVFDINDTIPTNITKNTIDAFAPISHMVTLPSTSTNPLHLVWSGVDDPGGSGLKSYTLYVSTDNVNFNIIRSGITRTDTTLTLATGQNYCFFVLATDSVNNMEVLRPGESRCTFIGGVLPVTLLYFNGTTQDKTNVLEWATSTELNSKDFALERSLDANTFTQIATLNAAGNSNSNKYYRYKDLNIDLLNSSVMYYRLKQNNLDGTFRYSNVVRLTYNQKSYVNSIVYPNPTDGQITLMVGENSLVGTNAMLYDINGRLLESIKIKSTSQSIKMNKYVNGVYLIRLVNKEVLKIIKN